MNDARRAILDRVRRAQKTGRVPTDAAHVRQSPAISAASTPDSDGKLRRFLVELDALGVAHHVASTAEEVRTRMAEVIRGRRTFAWDLDRLPYEVGPALGPSVTTGASPRDIQASAEIGVTGCHGAIVETGSIVVLSGRGMPRATSLLPPTHLCLVRRLDLYDSVRDFFRMQAHEIAAAACCTFITGPSRTADIELTLTLGVHGPGTVVVIVGP